MSTEALRITWDVYGTAFYESFYDYEVRLTPVSADDDDQFKELADGKPVRIARDKYQELSINFILQSTNESAESTLSKLKNIDAVDDTLYIYYKYISDNTAYLKCILPKGQIPDELVVAGQNAGGHEITINFLECET